jgi:RIO-like serine/threonine protein kinase
MKKQKKKNQSTNWSQTIKHQERRIAMLERDMAIIVEFLKKASRSKVKFT